MGVVSRVGRVDRRVLLVHGRRGRDEDDIAKAEHVELVGGRRPRRGGCVIEMVVVGSRHARWFVEVSRRSGSNGRGESSLDVREGNNNCRRERERSQLNSGMELQKLERLLKMTKMYVYTIIH